MLARNHQNHLQPSWSLAYLLKGVVSPLGGVVKVVNPQVQRVVNAQVQSEMILSNTVISIRKISYQCHSITSAKYRIDTDNILMVLITSSILLLCFSLSFKIGYCNHLLFILLIIYPRLSCYHVVLLHTQL